ncbi:MAG: efflux RND transporter periplasmic adaptor subunit [Chromatiales bacterium]|jgi:RND family efflux transporter MFP subunit
MQCKKIFLGFALLMLASMSGHAAAELQTVAVKPETIPEIYRLDGVVEAVSRSTISAQTSGQVTDIFFDVEDYVEKGSLLLQIKDTEQQTQLTKAKANLKAADAQLQDATAEYNRISEVYKKKLVAKADFDKASAGLKTAKAQQQAARAALQQAEEQLSYARVTAPYSGIVTERHVEVGETTQPGQPLMSGISLDKLRVVVDVPQSLIDPVRTLGQASVQKPDNTWIAAEQLTIFPIAEPGSNSFKVRLDLPAGTQGLLPGMFVKAAFLAGAREALIVPVSSVVYRSEVIGVYTVDSDGMVSFRHIRLGHTANNKGLIVLSGLDENDHVAVDPIAAGALLKQQRSGKVKPADAAHE